MKEAKKSDMAVRPFAEIVQVDVRSLTLRHSPRSGLTGPVLQCSPLSGFDDKRSMPRRHPSDWLLGGASEESVWIRSSHNWPIPRSTNCGYAIGTVRRRLGKDRGWSRFAASSPSPRGGSGLTVVDAPKAY